MAGYSGTPLWKKLGYQPQLPVLVESAPAHYLKALALPTEVAPKWCKRLDQSTRLVHVFSSSLASLESRLRALRKGVAPECIVWVSWPKKASGVATDITEDRIRAVALPLGFVDVKVCAIDQVWSGLKLVIRKELR